MVTFIIPFVSLSLNITSSLSDGEGSVLSLLLRLDFFLVLVVFMQFVVTDRCICPLFLAVVFMLSFRDSTSFLKPINASLNGRLRDLG